MNGWTFYRLYRDMGRRHETGNCLAVERSDGEMTHRGVGPTDSEPNSEVGPVEYAESFLRSRCRRISESAARVEHGKLVEYIEDNSESVTREPYDRWQISEGAY